MAFRPHFRAPRIHAPRLPRVRRPATTFRWQPERWARIAQRAAMFGGSILFLLEALLFEYRVVTGSPELGGGSLVTILVNSIPTILLAVMVGAGWWLRWSSRKWLGLGLVAAAALLQGLMLLF